MRTDVLIIADNVLNLYLAQFLLERDGLTVAVAHSEVEGVKMAESLLPALILLDIHPPEMDGIAVIKALRQHPNLASIPLIVVTLFGDQPERERILQAGADDFIEKPINLDSFVDQVRRHLEP